MNENASDRFGNFFDRVVTERTALKIVNETFSSRKLHGLTEAAINSWLADAHTDENGDTSIQAIASILKRLSSRIDSLGKR